MPSRATAAAATAAVFLLSVSGILTLHEGASRACPSWPLCLDSGAPLRLIALQYAHRLLGAVTAIVVLCAVRRWHDQRWAADPLAVTGVIHLRGPTCFETDPLMAVEQEG